MRRYAPPAAAAAALYLLNRLVLIPSTAGALHRLLAWHFADFLAGGLMLCVLGALLAAAGRPLRLRFPALRHGRNLHSPKNRLKIPLPWNLPLPRNS